MKTLMIQDEVYNKLKSVKGKMSFSELLDSMFNGAKQERNARFRKYRGVLSKKEANELRVASKQARSEFKERI